MSDKEFILLSFCFQWRTGRELVQMYKKQTGKSMGYGTLYTTMRSLKERGLVETRDSEDEDGVVREFKITAGGSRKRREEQARRPQNEPSPMLTPRTA